MGTLCGTAVVGQGPAIIAVMGMDSAVAGDAAVSAGVCQRIKCVTE